MEIHNEKTTRRWVLALASLASFMVALDTLVMSTALTSIRQSLGASLHELEWTVNAYNLSFAVLLTVAAAFGDRFGRRLIFSLGLALFVIASIACALSTNVAWLIAARAVQGAGAAFIMPVGMALISAAYPQDIRGKALGIFSGVTGLAVLGGPVIGGAIAQGIDWTWIFWINVPVGLLLIPFARRRIRESFGADTGVDGLGLLLVGGASFGAAWGLMRANEVGWSSAETLVSFAAAMILALAFVTWERRIPEPMLPMHFFRARAFSAGSAATFLLYGALYGTLFFMAQFLQIAQGHSPFDAGLRLLPWTATLFVVAPAAGALVNRIGERPLVVLGLLLQGIGMGWIGLTATPELPFMALVAPLIVAGAGVSMAMPAVQNAVLGAVGQAELGKASGAFEMAQFLGGVFGIAIAATVFSATGSYATPTAFTGGFLGAVSVTTTLSLLGALVALFLPGRPAPVLRPAE